MAGITRKTQKVFGSGLVPAGNVAQFGSLAAGAPNFSDDPDVIQGLAAWLNGLNGAVVGNRSPAIEDLNALFLVLTRQIAYVLARGIPEWDAGTEYNENDVCKVAGVVYISTADGNTNNDPSDPASASWQAYQDRIAPAKAQAKAWVNFNGNTGAILSAYNVANINRTAAGCYTIAFAAALADANYAVVGTCGPANGGSRNAPAGNNNHVSRDTITDVAQFSIWIPKPDQLFGEDSDLVSVVVFGN
jgi:hypothetical protein